MPVDVEIQSEQTNKKIFLLEQLIQHDETISDYFGNTKGESKVKNEVSYSYEWGKCLEVPIIEECHRTYECEVSKTIELNGAHLFSAEIKNIQIDKKYDTMDLFEFNKLNYRESYLNQ